MQRWSAGVKASLEYIYQTLEELRKMADLRCSRARRHKRAIMDWEGEVRDRLARQGREGTTDTGGAEDASKNFQITQVSSI